jgi:hypothetical protein
MSAGAGSPILDSHAMQRVLAAQPLPRLGLLPLTSDSHPFNGAAWQNEPINLGEHGYVEEEYLVSGAANVYDWVPYSDFDTRILRHGHYTTRILVRRPEERSVWSGRVVVELINAATRYDWTAVWSALWEQLLTKHDVYVGITARPVVFPGLQRFDPVRYAGLSMANPLAPGQQAGGTMPGDEDYDLNFSRLYENGLIWDIVTQTGRLLRRADGANPLGRPAELVILSGESEQAEYLCTYYKWFTPAATLADGRPIFDGYLAECLLLGDPQAFFPSLVAAPINQAAPIANPLPADDPQLAWVPARSVPWMGLNSQWDYAAARGADPPVNHDDDQHKAVFWELAGCHHGWAWQYLYGDACAADLIKAGFWDPATYDWACTVNNPEVPLYMAEKAAFEDLSSWITDGIAPPMPPPIRNRPRDDSIPYATFRDSPSYDSLDIAEGGLRLPMVDVPICSYGMARGALHPPSGLDQIVPFGPDTLRALYGSKGEYVRKYETAARGLVERRCLLPADAVRLIARASEVTCFAG